MKQYTDKIKAAYSFFSFSTSKESNRFSMCAQSLMHEPELFIDNVRTVFSPKKKCSTNHGCPWYLPHSDILGYLFGREWTCKKYFKIKYARQKQDLRLPKGSFKLLLFTSKITKIRSNSPQKTQTKQHISIQYGNSPLTC